MSKEKIILSVAAIVGGLIVAGLGFYLYQGTKVLPQEKQESNISLKPSPSPKSSIALVVDEPKDEEVVSSKVLKISGTTNPDAKIVILTGAGEDVLLPSKTGQFSTTLTINEGANLIEITALLPNGESKTEKRTVTYSTETF